jgi:hypothetical protein
MKRCLVTILLMIVVAAFCAYGQTFRGAINGTVTDPTGAVVAGANVTATETTTPMSLTNL